MTKTFTVQHKAKTDDGEIVATHADFDNAAEAIAALLAVKPDPDFPAETRQASIIMHDPDDESAGRVYLIRADDVDALKDALKAPAQPEPASAEPVKRGRP